MTLRRSTKFIALFILFVLFPFSEASAEQVRVAPSDIKVSFICPDNSPYWTQFQAFTREVAEDLDIDVEFIQGESDFQILKTLREMEKHFPENEYIVTSFLANGGPETLEISHRKNIPLVLINIDIDSKSRALIGKPREKYNNWLAHIHHDELKAGYDLADYLIREKRHVDKKAAVNMIAIGGPVDSLVGVQRSEGMKKRSNENPKVNLIRDIHTRWHEQHAEFAAFELLDHYKDINLIWAANDMLALSSIKAKDKLKHKAGQQVLVGGIDWTLDGVKAVKNGEMTVTYGGHVFTGGWTLILLFDYHHGIDFKYDYGTEITLEMSPIDKSNAARYLAVFQSDIWKKIDFKSYTKYHNKELKNYKLDALDIIADSEKILLKEQTELPITQVD